MVGGRWVGGMSVGGGEVGGRNGEKWGWVTGGEFNEIE